MSYETGAQRPPESLTSEEQSRLLHVTKNHSDGFRDHIVYSLALGTGLREFEIGSLNVGDVYRDDGKPRKVITLRVFKGHENSSAKGQEVHLPESLRYKLKTFWRWKQKANEPLGDNDPLFMSSRKQRISLRALHHQFGTWQDRAKFDRRFKFHALRHTCAYNLYKSTRDIRVVQRQLRHSNINTTTIYAVPSDQDMYQAVQDLQC